MDLNKIKKFVVVFMICGLTIPSHIWAAAMVTGCCSSTGPIATPQEVFLAAQTSAAEVIATTTAESLAIQAELTTVGTMIGNEIQKTRNSNEILLKEQVSQFRNLLMEYGAAKETVEATRTYGSAAAMDNLCSKPEIVGRVQSGLIAEKKVQGKLSSDIQEYNNNFTSTQAVIDALHEKETEDTTPENLLPKNQTLSAESVKKAQSLNEMITNPVPDLQISDDDKKKETGKEYEVVQKVKAARMMIPQEVFNRNIAAHSPSIPAEEKVMEIYESMGGTGTEEDAGIVNGMISPYAMLDLQVKSRYANPNWYLGLNSKNEVGLMRELVTMNAVGLEIQRRQLELTQLTALMLAQDVAQKVNAESNRELKELYSRVLSAN